MAEATPWQLARPAQQRVRKRDELIRDLYNFPGISISQGTNQPVVSLPAMGPGSAGAPFPTMYPFIIAVEITVVGSIWPEYGINT